MTVFTLALQAAHDALALAGPSDDAPGFMRTTDPTTYLSGQRLVLAREALIVAGRDRHSLDAETLAERFLPRLRELVQTGKIA